MNCLIRIRQRYPDLAQSDKKLADGISAHNSLPLRRASVSPAW